MFQGREIVLTIPSEVTKIDETTPWATVRVSDEVCVLFWKFSEHEALSFFNLCHSEKRIALAHVKNGVYLYWLYNSYNLPIPATSRIVADECMKWSNGTYRVPRRPPERSCYYD